MNGHGLDVITIGRASVDLYGEQVGGRLEDMSSFAKYVGGCPANIAIGTARLGLRSALITRVGDEHMGRFIRETLASEGVEVSHVKADPDRLTALVILGIRDSETFPLIFYREDCADMALADTDIDESFIASARAVVVTGTHFTTPGVDSASRRAMQLARDNGVRVVLDIDYRPVLWRLTGHGLGAERFVASANVTAHLQSILPECDLVVGTEEELHIAGGTTDIVTAIRRVRELTNAVIVCKRGPMGCAVFPGEIPGSLDEGIAGPGYPVAVYNVLGAGDAFMSGFLRGWLRDEPIETCCAYANACGAITVSRHGCAPAIPSWEELDYFLANGASAPALRKDAKIERMHWATTRTREWPQLLAMAIDHRTQFEEIADAAGVSHPHIGHFKQLALTAAERVAGERFDFGVLIDDRLGQAALDRVSGTSAWIGRPIELPGSRELQFEGGPDVGGTLREWPVNHTVKCLVFYHPHDPGALRAQQEAAVTQLYAACRATGHELLLEIIATRSDVPVTPQTTPQALARFYQIGVFPDWWKLPTPSGADEWRDIAGIMEEHDPHCRGVLLLGLDAPETDLFTSFSLAAQQPVCKGFAIGRTIFAEAAAAWFSGDMDDTGAIDRMARCYGRLIAAWEEAAS
ncbi:MAG: 5-dehydro-2-deoxygluconokinase [Alphaproteobacteria bacterium]|nr:5-dehydro-2-deoxygluconokinase [Alphaproteobacteria bacterium]